MAKWPIDRTMAKCLMRIPARVCTLLPTCWVLVFLIESHFPKEYLEVFRLVHVGKSLLKTVFIDCHAFKMEGHMSPEGHVVIVGPFRIRRLLDEVLLQDEFWDLGNHLILGQITG
jgi:hypothetical protein